MRYDDVLPALRAAYDARADWRDGLDKDPWRRAERAAFLDRLRDHDATGLLEVGAGTGQDSAWFQEHGLTVTAVDLSPAMVQRCRAKGVDAHVRDLLRLGFPPASFDAVYAMNCLLHVPNRDLPAALTAIGAVLRPGGLFYLGVWAGPHSGEGPLAGDDHDPPRFFSWRTDEQLRLATRASFDTVDFHVVPVGDRRFQSMTLRRV